MPRHLRVERGVAVAGLSGFGEGDWWVQDISASMPARLLGKGEARTALDLCAAPGGKTMQHAAAGFVGTAGAHSASRSATLCENPARPPLEAHTHMAAVLTIRN